MFQRTIDELFHGLPKAFDIIDDILFVGIDDLCRDHDATLEQEYAEK